MNLSEKVFDLFDEATFLVDKNMLIQSANKACLNMLNANKTEIVGKHCKEIFKSNPVLCDNCPLKESFSGEKIHEDKLLCIGQGEWNAKILPYKDTSNSSKELLVTLENSNELEELRWRVKERTKELETIYQMSNLVQSSYQTKGELLKEMVNILPSGWAYPEIAKARIILDDKTYVSSNFEETEWMLKEDIVVNGEERGSLEIFYTEEKPVMYEGPFLKEERKLLHTITERLNRIIERLETHEELKRQKRWFEVTLSSIGDGVIATDTKGVVTFTNPIACKLTEYSEKEMIGKKITEVFNIVNEDSGKETVIPVEKVLKDNIIVGLGNHTALISKTGKKYSIADAAAPIRMEDGNIGGVVLTFRDVTDIRDNRQKLKESERLFRFLAENSKDLIYRFRLVPEPKFEYVSPSTKKITGYSQKEHYENPQLGFKIVHPDDRKKLTAFMEGKIPVEPIILRWIKKDGTVIWIEMQMTPIYDSENKLVAIEGVSRDITKRKEIEEQLEKREKDMQNLISNLPGVVFKCKNNENWTMLFISKGCKRLLGYTPEELIDDQEISYASLIHPDDKQYVWDRVKEAEKTNNHYEIEYRIITKEEKIKTVLERGSFVGTHGSTIDGFITDITKMKIMQEKLKESEHFYKSIFEDTHEIMLIIDPDSSVIVDANEAACDFYGYSRDEIVNIRIPEMSTIDEKKVLEDFGRIKKAGTGISEAVDTLKNGEKRNILIYSSLIKREGKDLVLSIIHDITDLKRSQKKLKDTLSDLHNSFINSLRIIASITEARDPYTAGHQKRVSELSVAIAEDMALSKKRLEGLEMASLIHDIGKTSIPQELLTKPGKLTQIEFELIKEHPKIGYEIFKEHNFPWPIEKFIYEHHERLNGSGYPRGLKGNEISLEGRILAVADVVEAMSSNRPYRPSLGINEALDEIRKNAGILYDGNVVKACLKIFDKGFKFQD
jgi:PAS domain S-box-containing protein/putative nucleotidyltransferase with HDIG domain